ncbi:hypothetical protein ABEM11_22650 [Escherichia coli]
MMNEFYKHLREVAERKCPGKHGGVGYQQIAAALKIGSDEVKAVFTQHLKGAKRPNLINFAKVVEFLGLSRVALAHIYAEEQVTIAEKTMESGSIAAKEQKQLSIKTKAMERGNPKPKKWHVGLLVKALESIGGIYEGNNAGLQALITIEGKSIPVAGFYRLLAEACDKGLIQYDREMIFRHDEDGNEIREENGKRKGKAGRITIILQQKAADGE